MPAVEGFSVWQADDGEIKLEWTRQEDRDEVYAFLEASARDSMLKEPEEERTDEMKAGEELDLTKQEDGEKSLSSPETSAQDSIVAEEPDDSAVDQSEGAHFPKAWDAPEEGDVGTERATGESLASEGPVSLDPTERLSMEMESKKKAFYDFEGVIKLSDGAIKFAVRVPTTCLHDTPNTCSRSSNEQCSYPASVSLIRPFSPSKPSMISTKK